MNTNMIQNRLKIDSALNDFYWYDKVIQANGFIERDLFFNRIFNLTENLDGEELDIFLEILKNLDVYTLDDYNILINELYIQIRKKYPDLKRLEVAPLLKKSLSENNSIKSGHFVSYLFNSFDFSYIDQKYDFKEITIRIHKKLPDNLNLKDNELALLIDDFVGSGNQCSAALDEYLKKKYPSDQLIIGTLICLESGIDKISNYPYTHFYPRTGKTLLNITDSITQNKMLNVSNTLAKFLKTSDQFKQGYESSQALVVLFHTPNNSLPFIWSQKKESKRKALFSRRG